MQEVLEIVSFHKGRPLQILVTDPNFMGDAKRVDRLCDLLQRYKLDVKFSVMTRVDAVARHPRLVEKMCDNRILSYELGFESSNQRDLNNSRKGVTVDMQREAVRILRDCGADVSGTFMIGLPGQTEQEIRRLPVYAKEIGVMNCGFGIATPFPGTEFHNNLDGKGLIIERDWTKYDLMHSVFRLEGLDRKRLDELETYCMVRFCTLNTLLDNLSVLQKRSGKKISLRDFLKDIMGKIEFGKNAGGDLRKGEFENHLKVALEAMVDAEAEEEERRIDACNVVEISRFLDTLGAQKMQCTLNHKKLRPISYIIRTAKSSKSTVKYTKAIFGKERDATISVDIDLNDLIQSVNDDLSLDWMRIFVFLVKSARTVKGLWNTARLFTALAIELSYPHMKRSNK